MRLSKKTFIQILLRLTLCLLVGLSPVYSQEEEDGEDPSVAQLHKANNPLADLRELDMEDFYNPKLFGSSGQTTNSIIFRYFFPIKKWLLRASLPLVTVRSTPDAESGIGDADFFAAYLFINRPDLTFGFGPSLGFPTHSDSGLGVDKWTAGVVGAVYKVVNPTFQGGALVFWRHSYAGNSGPEVSDMEIQPFFFIQLGQGFYVRTWPTWVFDLEAGTYYIPFGLGMGKVIKVGTSVFNFVIEPQPTILHKGDGLPAMQIFAAVNVNFYRN